MSGRRIDVSATQVAASALAAVSGAVAASYLGVAGTLVGAALGSVASTAGTAVYKHYLARSQERLRKAAVIFAPRAGLSGIARHPGQEHAAGEPVRTAGGPVRTAREPAISARPSSPDYVATEVFPTVADHARGRPADLSRDGTGLSGRGDEDPTEFLPGLYRPRPRPGPAGDSAGTAETTRDSARAAETAAVSAGTAETTRDSARTAGTRRRGRPWIAPAAAALAVFLFAMSGITAFELVAGKPISSVLFHHGGSGTTVEDVVGGHARGSSPPAKPRPTTPAPTSRATVTPSHSPSPAPSQSPSPTPTVSPSPSSTPPSLGSASPSAPPG
jgi:hypothetical protein